MTQCHPLMCFQSRIYFLGFMVGLDEFFQNMNVGFKKEFLSRYFLQMIQTPIFHLLDYQLNLFRAHRHVTHYGQERGGIALVMENDHPISILVSYFQITQWWLKLYMHTLTIQSFSNDGGNFWNFLYA